jgi:parallel beta-helix repeat protein
MKKTSTLLLLLLFSLILHSQPSGGPHGPTQRNYELPAVPGTIFYVSPEGKSGSKGLTPDLPTSMEAAVEKAVSGDAIVMRGGTYRTGNLIFNQQIVIQPYRDEHPVLKGTKIAENWKKAGENLWVTHWSALFPGKPESWWRQGREERFTPLYRFNNDAVFINGQYLQSAGNTGEVNEGTFFVDYETGNIYIGTDPEGKLVEITAFRKALIRPDAEVRGLKPSGRGPVIRGLEITQYPDTMVHIGGAILAIDQHGKDITGTLFEDCTFSNCFRIGVFVISDSLVVRNCTFTHTNTEGLYVVASSDILLEKNIFGRNNIERWTGFYPAAVKIFNQCKRAEVRDNLVTDNPDSNGIWYDVGNTDGIFVNNWIRNIGTRTTPFRPNTIWNGQSGFFFEISKGVVCAGNVFEECDNGILILNSSNAKIYQNTFINSQAVIARDERSAQGDHFGWHPKTGPDVDERTGHEFGNNLCYGDETFLRPLLHIWQPNSLCQKLTEPALKKLDNNAFISTTDPGPVIMYSQNLNGNCQLPFNTPEEMSKATGVYCLKSMSRKNYRGPLFKGLHLGNYIPLHAFQGNGIATVLPDYVSRHNVSTGKKTYAGAYEPLSE